jgi:hypothetical protein
MFARIALPDMAFEQQGRARSSGKASGRGPPKLLGVAQGLPAPVGQDESAAATAGKTQALAEMANERQLVPQEVLNPILRDRPDPLAPVQRFQGCFSLPGDAFVIDGEVEERGGE